MTWGWQEIMDQCERLEPHRPSSSSYDFWILDAFEEHSRLVVRSRPGVHPVLQRADERILDLFMASNEFDQSLFITLTIAMGVDTMTALEICLS